MVTTYIRNRREAAAVARVARQFGYKVTVKEIYQYDRFIANLADWLFGANPGKTAFMREARQAVMEIRTQPRW
jgi:hypothetical protein